ncbi:peptide chain release factor N(5)-glutamine methyltransferase [Terrihabitans sp. B22-R8]|uniref:peptide chain release factor N(5)-glutamine methyltransferase n=1 Tax=Terrihabitans sp. B22-R8 TaxID=3425128 RepID=UPI00403C990D
MKTRRALLAEAAERLRMARCDSPELDARVLMKEALHLSDAELIAAANDPASPEGGIAFEAMIARRVAGEPVARIVGHREFWGLRFDLSAETLVPRPDTETLVEAAISACRGAAPRNVLDFGTGTGCLLIVLLHEFPDAEGLGVDISARALATAQRNAERLGVSGRVRFVQSDWGAGVEGAFDLIVSNPPYIAHEEIAGLDREVRVYDPPAALDGGADGLDAYRAVARDSARLLARDGVLIVELGQGQEADVAAAMRDAGLRADGPARPDLAGIPRALVVRRENILGNHAAND